MTLHDGDRNILQRMLLSIVKDSAKCASKSFRSRSRDVHSTYVEMLPLLDKYDCSLLKADVLEEISHCVETIVHCWDIQTFFEGHHDAISKVYGGVYPEELYPTFAEAWKAFEIAGEPTDKMFGVVENTLALASFLAKCYCQAIVDAKKAVNSTTKGVEKALEMQRS